VDGGDSQARAIKEGYSVACDVDILGNLERKERSHLSKCFFDINNDYQQNQR
jgi:hypothetical protein